MNSEALRSFARDRIMPSFQERSQSDDFDFDLWVELARLGTTGMIIEEAYAGAAAPINEFAQDVEIMASEGLDLGLTLSLVDHVMLCSYPVDIFGSEALRERYLPALSGGELIGAAAISEPGTGGDPLGRNLPAWLESMRHSIENAMLPLDELATEMLRDLRLLEVGSSLLDWQFQKLLF